MLLGATVSSSSSGPYIYSTVGMYVHHAPETREFQQCLLVCTCAPALLVRHTKHIKGSKVCQLSLQFLLTAAWPESDPSVSRVSPFSVILS